MEELIVEKVDNVDLRVRCDMGQKMELKAFSSFYAPAYQYHPKFKMRIWDGKVSYFDVRNSTIPIGMFPELFKFAKKFNYKLKLEFDVNELKPQEVTDEFLGEFYEKLFESTDIKPRDYQHDAIKSALNNRRGVIQAATGAGKSLIIYSLIRYLMAEGKKIMLVVPSVSLVNQMYSDFVDYGWLKAFEHVEKLYSGQKPTFGKQVLITTYQSLMRKGPAFFEPYEAIINDEAHTVKSVELQKIAKKCINADTRLGLTGTMPKELSDKYNIQGMLGPVIYNVKSKTLIDRGVLSKIKVVNTFLQYPDAIKQLGKRRSYHDEIRLIEETEERNNVFKYLFDKFPDGQNSIILADRLEHLDSITKYIEENVDDKYTLYVINGSVKADDRELIRKKIETEDNVILVATYGTVSTGINIKRIHNVILASSSKSEIRVLQSIGRGLRTHDNKEGVIIFDLIDDFSYENRNGGLVKNHVYRHWDERYKYYTEQEFPVYKKNVNLVGKLK